MTEPDIVVWVLKEPRLTKVLQTPIMLTEPPVSSVHLLYRGLTAKEAEEWKAE